MSETRSIKIRLSTYRRLKVLAALLGMSMLDLVDQLVDRAERDSSSASSATPRPSSSEAQHDAPNPR